MPLGETMRKLFLVLCASILLCAGVFAQDVNEPVQQMMKGFNTGDVKLIASVYASGEVTIIDEVAPHFWAGKDANNAWLADLDKHDKAAGVTDGNVAARPANRVEI